MSCFKVTEAHLLTITTFGAASPAQAAALTALLADANAASVQYRYREDVQPLDVDYMEVRAAFNTLRVPALEVVKLCDSLEYQCDYCPSWAMGYAKVVLDAIREAALESSGHAGYSREDYQTLVGYADAPWSIRHWREVRA